MNSPTKLTEAQEKEILHRWYTGNEAANSIAADMNITTGQALATINNARLKPVKPSEK